MYKFVVQANIDDEPEIITVTALTAEGAVNNVKKMYPNSLRIEIVKIKHTHGGWRQGGGRPSKWGTQTKVVRLPKRLGENLEEIVTELEMLKSVMEIWQERVDESCQRSASGEPAERFKNVAKLLSDMDIATAKIRETLQDIL